MKIQDQGIIWHVKSFDTLFWSIGNAMNEACSDPVPDNFLHLIRGELADSTFVIQQPKRRFCLTIALKNTELNDASA